MQGTDRISLLSCLLLSEQYRIWWKGISWKGSWLKSALCDTFCLLFIITLWKGTMESTWKRAASSVTGICIWILYILYFIFFILSRWILFYPYWMWQLMQWFTPIVFKVDFISWAIHLYFIGRQSLWCQFQCLLSLSTSVYHTSRASNLFLIRVIRSYLDNLHYWHFTFSAWLADNTGLLQGRVSPHNHCQGHLLNFSQQQNADNWEITSQ